MRPELVRIEIKDFVERLGIFSSLVENFAGSKRASSFTLVQLEVTGSRFSKLAGLSQFLETHCLLPRNSMINVFRYASKLYEGQYIDCCIGC